MPLNTCTKESLNFTFYLLEQTQLHSLGLFDWNVMSASQTGNNFHLHQSVFLLSKAPTDGFQYKLKPVNFKYHIKLAATKGCGHAQVSVILSFQGNKNQSNLKGFTFTQIPAWAQCGALLWLAYWRSTLQAGDTMCEWKFDGNPDLAAVIFSESRLLLCSYEERSLCTVGT